MKTCKEIPTQVIFRTPFLQNISGGCFCCFKKFVNLGEKHHWQRLNTYSFLTNTTEQDVHALLKLVEILHIYITWLSNVPAAFLVTICAEKIVSIIFQVEFDRLICISVNLYFHYLLLLLFILLSILSLFISSTCHASDHQYHLLYHQHPLQVISHYKQELREYRLKRYLFCYEKQSFCFSRSYSKKKKCIYVYFYCCNRISGILILENFVFT